MDSRWVFHKIAWGYSVLPDLPHLPAWLWTNYFSKNLSWAIWNWKVKSKNSIAYVKTCFFVYFHHLIEIVISVHFILIFIDNLPKKYFFYQIYGISWLHHFVWLMNQYDCLYSATKAKSNLSTFGYLVKTMGIGLFRLQPLQNSHFIFDCICDKKTISSTALS